jgi:hypothetical protein
MFCHPVAVLHNEVDHPLTAFDLPDAQLELLLHILNGAVHVLEHLQPSEDGVRHRALSIGLATHAPRRRTQQPSLPTTRVCAERSCSVADLINQADLDPVYSLINAELGAK